MSVCWLLPICLIALLATGCDGDRLTKLEQQNAELKAQLDKRDTALDYDLAAKCSKDAREWFGRNDVPDKDTILHDYQNHYNKALNRYFIFVEDHSGDVDKLWYATMSIWDVYENTKDAEYTDSHTVVPGGVVNKSMLFCSVEGRPCNSEGEWESQTDHYMTQ